MPILSNSLTHMALARAQVTEVLQPTVEAKVWPWEVDVVHLRLVAREDFSFRPQWLPMMLERALRDSNPIFSGEAAKMVMVGHLPGILTVIGGHKVVHSRKCRNSSHQWEVLDIIRIRA